jgi:hypothetical protein
LTVSSSSCIVLVTFTRLAGPDHVRLTAQGQEQATGRSTMLAVVQAQGGVRRGWKAGCDGSVLGQARLLAF